MSFASALAEIDAHNHAQVCKETWGHLAPIRNKKYKGHIVFALGCFGSDYLNPTTIECELGDMDSSPWFFGGLMEFLAGLKLEDCGVYRFDGYFRNYNFIGTVRKLELN